MSSSAAPVPFLHVVQPSLHPVIYSLWDLTRQGRQPDEAEAEASWVHRLSLEVSALVSTLFGQNSC